MQNEYVAVDSGHDTVQRSFYHKSHTPLALLTLKRVLYIVRTVLWAILFKMDLSTVLSRKTFPAQVTKVKLVGVGRAKMTAEIAIATNASVHFTTHVTLIWRNRK